ncbi:MarR family winged helix-turn-helix transcriptional regulator [Nisaea nitritireducens]|uniref:MarR family winged helix-turn-helix transcriptional regulator n=1 Tax=Nisaea nitritireducens TaxID=568392 RepID=UPI00186826B3|nr:MarR family transcriptional regulator [Nisaea nitritireducens]
MALEIHGMAGHMIRRLNQISVSVFQDRLKAAGYDLTPVQYACLATLEQKPGIDQATLAGLIAYDRATIGTVLDRLDTKGLVTRKVSPRDRRAREMHLTEIGRALYRTVTPLVQEIQTLMTGGLEPGERAEFLRLAAKLASTGNALSRAPMVEPD